MTGLFSLLNQFQKRPALFSVVHIVVPHSAALQLQAEAEVVKRSRRHLNLVHDVALQLWPCWRQWDCRKCRCVCFISDIFTSTKIDNNGINFHIFAIYFIVSSGGFRGGAPPPTTEKFLNFMQFFAKFGKIICWRPPRGLASPSYGKSWSAPCL